MGKSRDFVISIAILLVVATVLASVFAYYPLIVVITPSQPGLVFEPGDNAGQPDIGSNIISVTLGNNKTSANIVIHPTYHHNYYRDVLRIRNVDDDAMYVYLIFESVLNTLPSGSIVKVFFYEDNVKVVELDITSPVIGIPIPVGLISSGGVWQIDLYVYIPEGESIEGASFSATIKLVYTPSPETPPRKPVEGRYIIQPQITRVSRGALVYTDFEVFSEPGWIYWLGAWHLVSGVEGAKGNCLLVTGEGYYYWRTNISGYQSLWAAVRLRRGGGTRDVLGMFLSGRTFERRSGMYRIMVDVPNRVILVEVFILFTPPRTIVKGSIHGDLLNGFFTLVTHYSIFNNVITLRYYVYDVNGNLAKIDIEVCNATQCYIDSDGGLVVIVGDKDFVRPSYAGIYLRYPSGYFDGFVLSTIDPRTVIIEGLEPGMIVEIWDNLGNLVISDVATSNILKLNVVQDFVVGTGVNGRIVVKYSDGSIYTEYIVPGDNAIIGGDIYRIELI